MTSTVEISDLEIIESIDTVEFDESDHWICGTCYPNFVPGKIVVAACGSLAEDCPMGTNDTTGDDCPVCASLDLCPVCGDFLKF